jgi:hypothetical protein
VKRKILTFLLFFVMAAVLWYGHALQSVRNTRVPVLIHYTGKPGAIGLDGHLPDTVMIEVRDAGSRLNSYLSDPLHLTIDLRPYIHGEKGTIHVPSDALRRSISDILQGTSRLIETQPEQITCAYFTEQEKCVTLLFDGEVSPANEYQLVGSPTLSRSTVKIYGRERMLSTIDTLYTEHQNMQNISDTTVLRVALAVPKGMRAEVDSVDLSIVTERFTEKKFIVPLHVTGVPEGYAIRLYPKEVEVSVRMGIAHFAQVQESDIRAVCTYSPNRKDKLDVELHYTKPLITFAWAYPSVVEYLLIQQEQ